VKPSLTKFSLVLVFDNLLGNVSGLIQLSLSGAGKSVLRQMNRLTVREQR